MPSQGSAPEKTPLKPSDAASGSGAASGQSSAEAGAASFWENLAKPPPYPDGWQGELHSRRRGRKREDPNQLLLGSHVQPAQSETPQSAVAPQAGTVPAPQLPAPEAAFGRAALPSAAKVVPEEVRFVALTSARDISEASQYCEAAGEKLARGILDQLRKLREKPFSKKAEISRLVSNAIVSCESLYPSEEGGKFRMPLQSAIEEINQKLKAVRAGIDGDPQLGIRAVQSASREKARELCGEFSWRAAALGFVRHQQAALVTLSRHVFLDAIAEKIIPVKYEEQAASVPGRWKRELFNVHAGWFGAPLTERPGLSELMGRAYLAVARGSSYGLVARAMFRDESVEARHTGQALLRSDHPKHEQLCADVKDFLAAHPNQKIVVFTSDARHARYLARCFCSEQGQGVKAVALAGRSEMKAGEFKANLESFQAGQAQIAIATTGLRRGAGVADVGLVINFVPPATRAERLERLSWLTASQAPRLITYCVPYTQDMVHQHRSSKEEPHW